jgi:2-phosphoglycerate kinase
MTPLEVFLWDLLKSKMFKDKPRAVEDLKNIIIETVAISPAMLAAAFANMERRVGLCLQAEGNQFQRFL